MLKLVDIPKDERLTGYWVDLSAVQFSETTPDASWMQAFPVGEYHHPLYGKIKMTAERAQNMARNIVEKVRGIDPAIDYAHASAGEAAGWVKSAEGRFDGLWLFVEWTKEAAAAIRDKKWRYFSPEFVDEWTHPETKVKFKDVLLGGGLTNRPFLKNLLPVNLSEVLGEEDPAKRKEGGEQVDELLKLLRKKFSLAEDADQDTILAALDKALKPPEKKIEPAELSEAERTKLLSENPALSSILEQNKKLTDDNSALLGRVVGLETGARKATVSMQLAEWHAGGEAKKFGLPTSSDEKIESFMLSIGEASVSTFTEIINDIVKNGFVELGERTKTPRKRLGQDGKSIAQTAEDGIRKLMDDTDGMSYADASSEFFRLNEELYDAYLEESAESDEEVDA